MENTIEELSKIRIGFQPGKKETNNVAAYMRRNALAFPDRVAFRWPDIDEVSAFNGNLKTRFKTSQVTFSELYELMGRTARGLLNLGISPGDRVILFLPMNLGMYVAMFAIQHMGAISVFLDSWARRNHLSVCADCVNPVAMISHKAAFEVIEGIPEFKRMPYRIIFGPGADSSYSARLEDLMQTEETTPIEPVEREDTALVTFTTGSLGTPKGANRTHRFLSSQHEALKDVVPYRDNDWDIPTFPIFSLNNIFSALSTILPAIDLAQPSENDSAALVNQFLHEQISCTTLSPSLLNNLSAYCLKSDIRLTALRRVITGGAPISKDNVRDFKAIAPNAEIWILYGSTEVEPMAHIEAEEMLGLAENPDPEIVEEGVNVGHIYKSTRYKFIKPSREPIDFSSLSWDMLEVGPGEVGEFIVTGIHVCPNYYNNTEAFIKAKILDHDGTIWHRTGDLGYLDDQNYLWIVGRINNMILRAGRYFFPVRVEVILKRCEFIKRGAFLGFPDEQLGERTAIAVEFVEGLDDIDGVVKEILRLFEKNNIMVDAIYQVNDIPMDPRHHSKVEYSVLRDMITGGNREEMLCWER